MLMPSHGTLNVAAQAAGHNLLRHAVPPFPTGKVVVTAALANAPVYLLRQPGTDGVRALRALLKITLRKFHLRCLSVHEEQQR
jgi:hypothetical protein